MAPHVHDWVIKKVEFSRLPPIGGRNFQTKTAKNYGTTWLTKGPSYFIRWENEGRSNIIRQCRKCGKVKTQEEWGDLRMLEEKDIPPGWYPDDEGVTRWWDGKKWTRKVDKSSKDKESKWKLKKDSEKEDENT